jgi:hypothetical protein
MQDERMRASRSLFSSFLFAGLLLFGCGATAARTDPNHSADEGLAKPDAEGRFTLSVGGAAEVEPGLVLTLERVVSDSRCPVDVNCVWAGEIRLAFLLESPRTESPTLSFELATSAPAATARGLQFELLGAEPPPRSTAKIATADYRIALRVRRASREGS